jgi:DNA anti-recombination protein RmuC
MRSTALAIKHEYDEVPVSSNEVLEANVVAIRDNLSEWKNDYREFKNDFRVAVARIDNDIKALASRLEGEIRAMAENATRGLEKFSERIEQQLSEMRAEDKALREKVDSLDRKVDHIDTKLTALLWVVGGLGTLITVAVTVGQALNWF